MKDYLGKNTPKLGFGLMRLPTIPGGTDQDIDLEKVKQMVDLFLERGYTYFDTAYLYHGGKSEEALREAVVKRYPRDKFTVTDKMPLWDIKVEADYERIFQTQLQRTGLEYFDYYFLHGIGESQLELIDKTGGWDYMKKLKERGLVKHIGFSFHSPAACLDKILTAHPETELVQLQINYADWENPSVESRLCWETARRYGKPVIIMEPVKGGTLAKLPQNLGAQVRDRYDGSPASLAIRFAASFDGVAMVLSGMSEMSQVLDHISFMEDFKPLTDSEMKLAMDLSGQLATAAGIKCTACAYCVSGCPKNIPIPGLFACYNQKKMFSDWNSSYYYGVRTTGRGKASDCIRCGKCEQICPQKLPIREWMATVAETFEKEKDDED